MAITVNARTPTTSQALGIGTNLTASFGSIAFGSGRALLAFLYWGDATSTITVSALTLGTDGAMTQHPNGPLFNGNDTRGTWFFIGSNSGTQTLSATYTSSANAGVMGCEIFELTGATGYGANVATDITNALTFSLTVGTGEGAFVGIQGGGSDPGAMSGGGGTWTDTNVNNANRIAWTSDNVTISSGAQTLSWTSGDWAYAITVSGASPMFEDDYYFNTKGILVPPTVSLYG